MIILNNKINLVHIGPKITLKPGANTLENTKEVIEAWAEAKKLDTVKFLIENGLLVEKATEVELWPVGEFKVAVEAITDAATLAALDKKVTDAAKKKIIADQVAYLKK